MSSTRVVCRFDTHTRASLAWSIAGLKVEICSEEIPVISETWFQRWRFESESVSLSLSSKECDVMGSHDFPKNLTRFGAKSSCKVQPRVNHWSPRKLETLVVSARCTMQTLDFEYQLNIERIDSSSSALLLLSMQPESNQTKRLKCRVEIQQNMMSFSKLGKRVSFWSAGNNFLYDRFILGRNWAELALVLTVLFTARLITSFRISAPLVGESNLINLRNGSRWPANFDISLNANSPPPSHRWERIAYEVCSFIQFSVERRMASWVTWEIQCSLYFVVSSIKSVVREFLWTSCMLSRSRRKIGSWFWIWVLTTPSITRMEKHQWRSGHPVTNTAKIHVGYVFFRVDVDKEHQKATKKKTHTLYNEKGKIKQINGMWCGRSNITYTLARWKKGKGVSEW